MAKREHKPFQPFQPGAASTPYPGGEPIEMQTWQHEQTGLPETSYGGTSRKITDEEIERRLEALRDPNTGILPDSAIPLVPPSLQNEEIKRVKKLIKALYPEAKVEELDIKFSKNKIMVVGPRGGETKIALDDGKGLQQEFLKKTFVKNVVGDPAQKIIRINTDSIRKRQKELRN